jgi:hypothetical protein
MAAHARIERSGALMRCEIVTVLPALLDSDR